MEKGYSKDVASRVWGFIEAFANYGFNKAHATSYAMIAYQTAYLKANYPVEYMTALMSIESGSHSMNRDTRVAVAVENSKQMGIKVLPPDINLSSDDFSIGQEEDSLQGLSVRFGFNAIKHVGSASIENILETRKKVGGQFTSLTQFIHETDGRKVNKTTLECLIKVGAMDRFGTRASMLENLESIRQTASQLNSDVKGQDSLFQGVSKSASEMKDTFPAIPEYSNQELLSFEKELLGMYLTDHPMANALKSVAKRATKTISEIDVSIHKGQTFLFGGVVSNIREVRTKKANSLMAFGKIEDNSGSTSFVVFPKTYAQYGGALREDAVVLIKAKVDYRDEEMQLIAEKISAPDQQLEEASQAVDADHEIFIPRNTNKDTLEELGKLLKDHAGDDSVVILIPNGSKPHRMLLPYGVKWSEMLDKSVQEMLNT